MLLAFSQLVTAQEDVPAGVQQEEKREAVSVMDRMAFKTNAFEWLVTIPNVGFEFDLMDSEFNDMTLGLTAKYNWNTAHRYAPPMVFNLLDFRPEFRYWYRTKKPTRASANEKWSLEKFLKEKKHPKPWRAHYVGAYTNFASYTTKLGQRGYQGNAVGFGVSAGYSLPMYEYKDGFIDVELGASVGLQVTTTDVFVHSPDGYYYANVISESKGLHLTPFPVVSELRVAFVWRTKSIKDKVKDDTEKARVKRHYAKLKADIIYPFENETTKANYDEVLVNTKSDRERAQIMAVDSLYRNGFLQLLDETERTQLDNIPMAFPDDMKAHERADIREYVQSLEASLLKQVAKCKKKALAAFEQDWKNADSDKAKAAAQAEKERQKNMTPEEKEAAKAAEKEKAEAEKAAKAKAKADAKAAKEAEKAAKNEENKEAEE